MKELTQAFEAKQLKDKQAFLEAMKILEQLDFNGKLIIEPNNNLVIQESIKSPLRISPISHTDKEEEEPIRQDVVRNNNINIGEGLEYNKEDKLEVIDIGPTNLVAARKLSKDNKYLQIVIKDELIEFFELLRELTDMAIDDGHDKGTVDYLINIIDEQLNMFRGNDVEVLIEEDNTSLFNDSNTNEEKPTIKKTFSKRVAGRIDVD